MRIYAIKPTLGAGIALVSLCLAPWFGHVSAASPNASKLFSRTVLPVFQRACLGCHGEQAQSGLDLRTSEAALRGGRRGPSIVPGQPAKSLLIQAITGAGALKMPPGGARLSADTIEVIAKWIEGGAHWGSAAVQTKWSYLPQDVVWAFQPLGKYEPPRVATKQPVNPVDTFIVAKLNGKHLDPEPRVEKVTLLRRATFDLIGLPSVCIGRLSRGGVPDRVVPQKGES